MARAVRSETLAQAITRIYGSPQDRMNYDIWLRGEMLENHRTGIRRQQTTFDTPLMHCVFCHNPKRYPVEIRHVPASDKFAEVTLP